MIFQLLLGHLTGDYLLQNEWMALNKAKNTWIGWLTASIHCILYTLAVCLFMWKFKVIWIIAVFLSHFPIDKFSLAEKYMHYLKGKGMKDYVVKHSNMKVPNGYDMLEGGFTAVVYTITDNTMHLILMWIAYKLIF